jgi:hypothetical protein
MQGSAKARKDKQKTVLKQVARQTQGHENHNEQKGMTREKPGVHYGDFVLNSRAHIRYAGTLPLELLCQTFLGLGIFEIGSLKVFSQPPV